MDVTIMGFNEDWWAAHWWLLFPIFGFLMAFYSMWLQHRRSRDWMEVMKTYAQQGKEPPASMTPPGDAWGNPWDGRRGGFYYGMRRWPFFDVRRGIFFGVLAGAFYYLYQHNPAQNDGFGIAAIILGALAIGYIVMALIPRPKADEPPRPDGK